MWLKKLPHSKHLYKFQSISFFFLHFRHHSCWRGHLVYPHMLLPQEEHHEKQQRMETVIPYPFGQKKNIFFTCQRTVTILRNLISYHVHITKLKQMKAAYTKVTFLIIAKYVLQRLETLATIYDYF